MNACKERIQLSKVFLLFLALVVLEGCGGGNSGQEVAPNVDRSEVEVGSGVVYNGPDPTTNDVNNFKVNLWDNLASDERCGACHVEGGQAPRFVRADDINLAYQNAASLVDLVVPSNSRLVTKVAEGHNCWRPEVSVCADTITNFIAAWGSDAGAVTNEIVLTASDIPTPLVDVGSSKTFPDDNAGFASLIHTPYLARHCVSCHSEDAEDAQQPFFASANTDVAYSAAKSKINLDTPASSRFVLRLSLESHQCWSANCDNDADALEAAIAAYADAIEPTAVDPALVTSKEVGLAQDGVVISSGGRVDTDVIAMYQFKTGAGDTVYDTSVVSPAMDLTREGNTAWLNSWGLRIYDGFAKASTSDSEKLNTWIGATGEYSIEAWVVPDNVTQEGPARIASYSGGPETRNFTLGQTLYNYNFMSRSSKSDANGMPMLSTADADEVLQATLQHVVATFHPITGRTIYVNGELVATDEDFLPDPEDRGGNLNEWDTTFAFAIGSEAGGDNVFQGTIRFLAIHNRVLSEEAISANFDAGVGQKFFLMFGIEELTGIARSFIVFQVEVYDDYAYLFSAPFYTAIDNDTAPTSDINIRGLRIGVNGREATVGQAFANVAFTVNSENYNTGAPLSDLGAVIALEKGPENDRFFLTFDAIGDAGYNRLEPDPAPAAAQFNAEEQSDIGLRTFAELNGTFATLVGLTSTNAQFDSVYEVYEGVKRQLPSDEAIDGFLPAYQAGIMQLSVAYCSAVVDTSLLGDLYPGITLSGTLSSEDADVVIDAMANTLLLNEIIVDGNPETLAGQPSLTDFELHLRTLADSLANADARNAVIAICSAALGNAATLLQ